jgi:hypothetical protein
MQGVGSGSVTVDLTHWRRRRSTKQHSFSLSDSHSQGDSLSSFILSSFSCYIWWSAYFKNLGFKLQFFAYCVESWSNTTIIAPTFLIESVYLDRHVLVSDTTHTSDGKRVRCPTRVGVWHNTDTCHYIQLINFSNILPVLMCLCQCRV